MDDLSSTDSDTSQSYNKFSLKERNSLLEQENIVLKAQIADAVSITDKIDDLQKENLRLSEEIVNLTTANDNIHCRLQISLQTNSDLLQSIETQKKNFATQLENDRNSAQIETSKLKDKYKAHIDQIYDELSKVKSGNDELEVQQKIIVNKIQRTLEAANQFFNLKFSNLDDLTTYFKQSTLLQNTNPDVSTKPATSKQDQTSQNADLLKVVKNLKKKLKNSKSETERLDKSLQDSQLTYTKDLSNLQRKYDILQNEKNESDSNNEKTISELKSQISFLKDNLDDVKQQLRKKQTTGQLKLTQRNQIIPEVQLLDPEVPIQKSSPITEKVVRDKTDEREIQELNHRISELTDEISSYQKKHNEHQDLIRKYEDKQQNLEIKYTKLENDFNSLQIVHDESLAEIETLRKSLHERQQVANKKAPIAQNHQEKDKKALQQKDAKITELQNDLHQLRTENDGLSSKIKEMESIMASKDTDYKKMKEEFDDYVVRAESKHVVTVDDLLPPGSFRYPNFDSSLQAEIEKIASNPSLQIPSKIEHSFRSIEGFYNTKMKELQQISQDSIEEMNQLINKIKQFLTDVAIAFTGSPVTANKCKPSILSDMDELQNVLIEFNKNYSIILREKEQLQTMISQISSALGTDDILGTINELKDQNESQSGRLSSLKKKNKVLSKQIVGINSKFENEISQLSNDLDIYKSQSEELESKNKEQCEVIKKIRTENRSLQNEINSVTEAKKELEATLRENSENELSLLNQKYQELENQFKSKINGLVNQIQQGQEEKSSLESTITSLENQIKNNNSKIKSLINEKADIQREKEDEIQNLTNRFNTEKHSLKKSYDQAFNQMKSKNEKCRDDIEKLSKSIVEKDNMIDELNKSIKALSLTKGKALNEIRALNEQIDREKKLSEATLKSQTCSIETKYKEKIEIIKGQALEEQQKIILYLIDAFRSIFCGFVGKIEDKSYKLLIDKIREHYKKLLDSDQAIRRMLNVTDRQTTQDAVAQLLINH